MNRIKGVNYLNNSSYDKFWDEWQSKNFKQVRQHESKLTYDLRQISLKTFAIKYYDEDDNEACLSERVVCPEFFLYDEIAQNVDPDQTPKSENGVLKFCSTLRNFFVKLTVWSNGRNANAAQTRSKVPNWLNWIKMYEYLES